MWAFDKLVWDDDCDAYDLRGCRWVLWEVVGLKHGGELQSSEIPFGYISIFSQSLAVSY